ncbi:histidine ammonia-lyase [Neolewinella aurantiaca]|uniref:Histidine ammonia-lyase n=1 Tax=Neolewinella aurantiaca TaxID=2602767 RepID=A0A5C7FHH8_9BACT|nr:histidine ammonia-lyase [Neolewinella aurantiaca]TXF90567.1 histidine ammonia-lyase [Neolewinella aurantiaca]
MPFSYGQDHLTAGKALAIARGELSTAISQETIERIEASHVTVLQIAAADSAVYGINTGFGPLCNKRIKPEETVALQRNLLLSHSVGMGEPIRTELAKLMLILKVHALCKAYSGIALYVIERICWHIDNDVIPVVPEQGSVGASGDLAPLSHLFLPLIGEGEVIYGGNRQPAASVLKTHGMEPLDLHPKAGLALINGTQFMLAHAVTIVEELQSLLSHADLIAALMVDGLLGSAMPFHPALHATRPHKGNTHVAARMAHFLAGSEINASHINCDRVQDPYSLRCAPQVHGASRHAWLHLKEIVETELNSVTDNPVVINGELIISGGSFHGQPIALPMDYACLAAHEVGSISDRRSYFSLYGISGSVPKLLVKDTGLHSGLMIVQYTGAALVSENKSLCFPASADSIPTSLGQEDHVSMGSISGRKTLRVCGNLRKILAVELFCASQALDFHRPLKSSATLEAVHAHVRGQIEHAAADRIYGEDLLKAEEIIRSGKLLEIVAEYGPEGFSGFDVDFEVF